ncbi:hypothetical protein [Pantoea sp. At-9b]|uniref:hypothetical protein n=1 Tax=Pantoea sp. (strain At-9b) TaxID=592316 RepID=UPI0001B3F4EA|nr:hypothetical protein [Pantoea sp. At-9b]ADU69447.1 hypothetical protein Pat9b_2135 [Pantoea sp. At-9b]
MKSNESAYIDDTGNLAVIDIFDSVRHVPLAEVDSPEQLIQQLQLLTAQSSFSHKALDMAFEIMAEKIGLGAGC